MGLSKFIVQDLHKINRKSASPARRQKTAEKSHGIAVQLIWQGAGNFRIRTSRSAVPRCQPSAPVLRDEAGELL